jgi:hypothetical protein
MVMNMTDKTRDLLLGAACAALILAPLPVFAADAAGEVATAATHATLASQAADLDGVKMHLHHTLNCLVGLSGAGFDPKQINPCAGSGSGAIPDTSDAAKKKALEEAANTVRAGLAASDVAVAKKAASETATALKAIK